MPYITPETTPSLFKRRCLFIPDDPRWLAAVNGAVSELLKPYNWQQTDGITPEDAADAAATMFYEYLQECSGMEIGMLVPTIVYAPVPAGMLRMDGGTYDEVDYPELFAVLPDNWKDGSTFTLPNMQKRGVIGAAPFTGFINGQTGGEETHTLTVAEMPVHNHMSAVTGNLVSVEGSGGSQGFAAGTFRFNNAANVANRGGGGAHNNMPPYLAAFWLIVAR